MQFFTKKLEILPKRSLTKALPWQHHRLLSTKTVSNDVLYKYTKSQKVSSAYRKPFWYYSAKNPILNRVNGLLDKDTVACSQRGELPQDLFKIIKNM